MADETGLRCPKCSTNSNRRPDELHITVLRSLSLLEIDSDELESIGGDAGAWCSNCQHHATVADFRPKSVAQMLLEVAEAIIESNSHDDVVDARSLAREALAAHKERGPDG